MRNVDVIVVGAGPAGLMSALLLARMGVQVLLVEQRNTTSFHPKARGLNVRTMEILRSLGLEAEVRRAGDALSKNRYMLFVESLAGNEERRIPDDDLMMKGEALAQYTPCTWAQCAQDSLESLLAKNAAAAGADLIFGACLRSFTQDEHGVICTIANRNKDEERILARYLIACDGAKSTIREQLGIKLAGRAAIEHFVNIYFEADLKPLVEGRWFGICFVNNAEVRGLFLPVDNDRRWLLNVEYDPAGKGVESFTPERCKSLVKAAIGDRLIRINILSALPWVASSLAAPRLRSGRVFLVGDAGHILPPAGGFGLNLAIQDAHNLAWKLAGVVHGTLAAFYLDSYEAERLPAAASVARYSEDEIDADQPWEHGDNNPDGPPSTEHEDAGGGGGSKPWEQSLEQQLEAVIGFQYQSDLVKPAYAAEGLKLQAAPGTRFPHVWVGEHQSSLDLLPMSFCVCASDTLRSGSAALPLVTIPSAIWKKIVGGRQVEAALVRPDGIVAAVGTLDEVLAFHSR